MNDLLVLLASFDHDPHTPGTWRCQGFVADSLLVKQQPLITLGLGNCSCVALSPASLQSSAALT